MSEEFLEGWAIARLGDLATKIGSGATPRGGSSAYAISGTPLIRSQNVYFDGFRDVGLVFLDSRQAAALDGVKVQTADVFLNITGASIGRACIAPERMANARVNQHVAIIRPKQRSILPSLLAMYLESPSIQLRINTEEYGVTRQALTKGWIEDLEVPIPPLPEQHRIVEKVEALLDQVNRAKERLGRVPLILKRFRQAVLAAACSGELTRDWREEHPVRESVPSLALAAEERRAEWLAAGRSRRASNYSVPEPVEQSGELPTSWRWTSGREMFLWGSGAFLPKSKMKTGAIPVYGGNGVSGQHNESIVEHPTLVIGRVGALCGNVHVTDGPAWVTDNAIYALWVASVMNLDFARMLFTSHNLNANAGGSGQPFVSQELLDNQVLPFPPPEEQAEIVRCVKRLNALADTIERRVQAATARANKLPQAILSKAFSGELVPTEAELARLEGRTYETAEELLKRVTAMGSDVPSARKGRVTRAR